MIPLYRAKTLIDNIFSALGDIKETNLTACLAYLVSAYPDKLGPLFVNKEKIIKIDIEHTTSDMNRHDIILSTNESQIIIEAKLGFQQNKNQIIRYLREQAKKNSRVKLVLLDRGSWQSSSWTKELKKHIGKNVKIQFIQWSEIHKRLHSLLRLKKVQKANERAFALIKELCRYMEVNGMDPLERKEVYVRDLATEKSIELFFRYHIYISQPKFYNSARGNAYFGPYFTGAAPSRFEERSSIRLGVGISYIAPIKDLQIVTRSEVREYLKASGVERYKEAAKLLLSYADKGRAKVMIFILGEPVQAFLTPIVKKQLGFTGAMGAKSLTFQQLFESTNISKV